MHLRWRLALDAAAFQRSQQGLHSALGVAASSEPSQNVSWAFLDFLNELVYLHVLVSALEVTSLVCLEEMNPALAVFCLSGEVLLFGAFH